MESTGKSEVSRDASLQSAVKVAGVMFLLCFIVPTLNWALLLSGLDVAGDPIATAGNIMAHEALFRIGVAIELMMSVGLVVLAVALYSILRRVNRTLAVLALAWKVIEACLVAVLVLLSLVALQLAGGNEALRPFTQEQMMVPVGLLLNTHTVLYGVPMVFLGLDMTLFFYLFLKSRDVPRSLAGFGILSFVLIFIHALGNIVAPELAATTAAQVICYLPSCIVEVVMGTWLLTKGLRIHPNCEPMEHPL